LLSHSSADHRALHSFPTRRSSDLAPSPRPARSLQHLARIEGVAHGLADENEEAQHRRDGEEAGEPEPRRLQIGFALRQKLAQRRSEEHTSELQSRENLVCRLLLEK